MNDLKLDAFNVNQQPDLPPAGYKRDDVLAQRTDQLQEEAEKRADEREVGAIPHDHAALNPERNREIQDHIRKDHLAIGADHPYLKTKWVNWKNLEGQMVWQAKNEGWQVATIKEFPEAVSMVKEDNTIRVADVMLMCIRMDEYFKLEERAKEKRLRQQYGVEAEIHDLAMKTNRKMGQDVFAGVSTPEVGVSGNISDAAQRKMAQMEGTRRVAMKHLGNKMKTGTLPGVPIK